MDLDLIAIGKRLAQVRINNHYTMGEFGKLLGGVNKSAVNNWEKGRNLPEKKRLEQIALLGRTDTNTLLYGSFSTYIYNVLWHRLIPEEDVSQEFWDKSDELASYLDAYVKDEKFSDTPDYATAKRNALTDVANHLAENKLSNKLTYGQDEAIEDEALKYLKDMTQPKSTNHGLVNMITAELTESVSDVGWLENHESYDETNHSSSTITPEFANEVRNILKDALQQIIDLEEDYKGK